MATGEGGTKVELGLEVAGLVFVDTKDLPDKKSSLARTASI